MVVQWYGGAVLRSWRVMQKNIVCHLQGQGHSEGSYDQTMTVSTISSKLILLQPHLVSWYIILNWGILRKKWIAVFKVKVTVKVRNVGGCLSG